jgi:hypothetical protein
LDGDRLVAANGGWFTDSGTVDGYLFRFVRDDGITRGPEPPPPRETHEAARARLAANPSNEYALTPGDRGHSWRAECYAVTFSGAWGNEPAWAEWGGPEAAHRDDPNTYPNRSPSVFVPVPAPPAVKPLTWYRDQALAILDEAAKVHGAAVTDSTRVRHMLRVGRTTDAKRKLVDPALDRIGV